LHLGNETSGETEHVNGKEASEIHLGVIKHCVNDSLKSYVVLNIVSELSVDVLDDFLNGGSLPSCHWFPSSDVGQLSEQV